MPEEKPTFPTKRLHHVGIVVKDLEKAIAQLEALGFGPFMFDEQHRTFAIDFKGELHGEPAEWTTLISNAKMGEVELELLEPVEGNQALKETLDAQGEGLHHIGWLTTDLQGDMERPRRRAPRSGPAPSCPASPASATWRTPRWPIWPSNCGSRR